MSGFWKNRQELWWLPAEHPALGETKQPPRVEVSGFASECKHRRARVSLDRLGPPHLLQESSYDYPQHGRDTGEKSLIDRKRSEGLRLGAVIPPWHP